MRVSIVSILVALVAMGSDCPVEPEQKDFGLLTDDVGNPLCPAVLPWEVICDSSCAGAAGDWFEPGLEWWNERIPGSFVSLGQDEEEFHRRWDGGVFGTVFVSIESLPGEIDWEGVVQYDEGGVAQLGWDDEGHIVSAWVRINHDHAYDETFVLTTFKHEMGHTLGFADDMGPPQTVDLGSIMGSPTPSDGGLLDSDRRLWQETCSLDR